MTEHIRVTKQDGVGFLTIARRERQNSFDVQTARDFRKAGLTLARDPAVRVVVLAGEGGVFCSGADLKYIRAGGDAEDLGYLTPGSFQPTAGPGAIFKQILEYLHATISEIRRSGKPWIAAVDGAAAAGGLGIALACDLVVASERASFEWAYFKTGLCGAESTTFLLPRLVGFHRAMELVLLGSRLSGRQAQEWGLINAVFPDASFAEDVRALATRLAALPAGAVATAKSLLNHGAGFDRLDVHLDEEIAHLAQSADSADFAEGLEAFFAKRKPSFGGAR